MSLVMGMDQHRAQISAEWIDTMTGEVSRARVAPGGPGRGARVPDAVRRRGAGGRVGGDDRLAVRGRGAASGSARRCIWPSRRRPAALKGNKKRAKTDWADARHLRELLMIGRLPESWIPPDAHPRSARPGAAASHAARSSAPSGSSGSRRCSITTAARSGAQLMTSATAASGSPLSSCPPPRASRSRSRWR